MTVVSIWSWFTAPNVPIPTDERSRENAIKFLMNSAKKAE